MPRYPENPHVAPAEPGTALTRAIGILLIMVVLTALSLAFNGWVLMLILIVISGPVGINAVGFWYCVFLVTGFRVLRAIRRVLVNLTDNSEK